MNIFSKYPGMILLTVVLACTRLCAQASSGGYVNYAVEDYTQEQIEQTQAAYYDLLGNYILNGNYIYQIQSGMSHSQVFGYDDYLYRSSTNYQNGLFFTNFQNLVLSSDQIGGFKSSVIFGDRINTRFTSLTLDKRHFKGIRWDLFRNGFEFTSLISRTRPDAISKENSGASSSASYSTSEEAWISANKDYDDWSTQSMYGDYDFYFGFHGQKRLADAVNVGMSFTNHHHNDAKNGESFFGEVPDDFAPREIHLEIYDLTPENTMDPGARVIDVRMSINGQSVGGPHGVYKVDAANILRLVQRPGGAAMAPDSTHGEHPVICTFYPRVHGIAEEDIKNVHFDITVEGNYLIFVSTEKMTPLYKHWGQISPTRYGPIQYTIQDIVDREINGDGPSGPVKLDIPSLDIHRTDRSEVYFGQYIARSPRVVSSYGNRTTIPYDYAVDVASMVASINMDGRLYGTDFAAEIAMNNKRSVYPTAAGEVRNDFNLAGYLQLQRPGAENVPVLKDMTLKADIYNIAASYEPNLPHYDVSRSFSRMTNPKMAMVEFTGTNMPHFMDYPIQLCNYWQAVDDNDDDDFYAENERKPYPSEYSASYSKGKFFGDGSHRTNVSGWGYNSLLLLPSNFKIQYEDYDGVVAERYNKNRNSEVDYREDFLLYESDPPALNLELDRNNNKIFDIEEDDLAPDYPYQTGQVYTSNGVQNLGIQGVQGGFNYVPLPYLNIDAGCVYERILDPDLDGESESVSDLGYGQNFSLYSMGIFNLRDRNKGITWFAGQELKKVNDVIRNDGIEGTRETGWQYSPIYYRVRPDMLELKDALVSNTSLGVEYVGIPNLELSTRALLGVEKHFAGDSIYVTQSVEDTVYPYNVFYVDDAFISARVPYKDKQINSLIYMVKGAYTIKPSFNFTGMAWPLNLLNRMELTPQYKLLYEYHGTKEADPRIDSTAFVALTADQAFTNIWDWREFRANNENILFSVPIIRLNYKLGEKTFLEGGWQWKRVQDFQVPEESYFKRTTVLQVRNKNTYSGYDITLLFGLNTVRWDYDINDRNTIYETGNTTNHNSSRLFFEIYAGSN